LISKSQIKLITSLGQKKYRDKTGLFVAEGPKLVSELLQAGFSPHSIFTSNATTFNGPKQQEISEAELKKISFLKTPHIILGVFHKPNLPALETKGLTVVLDGIQDPGNLGTLIRLCDWFGVSQLVCSPHTVDCYNPKVVQATMGSIARVAVHYLDLQLYLERVSSPIYGAFMDGSNVYAQHLQSEAVLILGNEGRGVSTEVARFIGHRISIPQFGNSHDTESLNVATAGAILLSEFKRTTGR
jgi:TrmH family RNA methyltransferase